MYFVMKTKGKLNEQGGEKSAAVTNNKQKASKPNDNKSTYV